MKRLTLALVAFLLIGAAPAQAQERCTKGKTVAADTHARIYTLKGRWFACNRTTTRSIRLAGVGKRSLSRVTYPYAAVTTTDQKVRMFDVPAGTKTAMRAPGPVSDLELAQGGTVFAIAGGQVLRMNAKGEVVKLDEGAIARGSLAATWDGTFVYWIKDGVARSASFAEPPERNLTARRAPHCGRSKARGYLADAGGWLLWESTDDVFFACLDGRKRGLWFTGSDDWYAATIESPYVALVLLGLSPYGSGSNEVVVHDLRNTGETSDYTSYDAQSFVSQLRVTDRGVAYILEAGAVNMDGQVIGKPELLRLDQRNRVTKLDAGGIVEGTLVLTPDNRRGYYVKDGAVKTFRP